MTASSSQSASHLPGCTPTGLGPRRPRRPLGLGRTDHHSLKSRCVGLPADPAAAASGGQDARLGGVERCRRNPWPRRLQRPLGSGRTDHDSREENRVEYWRTRAPARFRPEERSTRARLERCRIKTCDGPSVGTNLARRAAAASCGKWNTFRERRCHRGHEELCSECRAGLRCRARRSRKRPGDITSLLGPSGSGKLTCSALLPASNSPIRRNRAREPRRHQRLTARSTSGVRVPELCPLPPHDRLRQRGVRDVNPQEIQSGGGRRSKSCCRSCSSSSLGARFPSYSPLGASASASRSPGRSRPSHRLLLDEPFGALDARVRLELREWLAGFQQQTKVTTILVIHD